MQKRKIIILIIIIIILILVGLFLSYLITPKDNIRNEEDTGFLPILFNILKRGEDSINTIIDYVIPEDEKENTEEINNINKLNKISSTPISGYSIFKKEIYIQVPDIIKENNTETINGEVSTTGNIKKGEEKITEPKTEFIEVLRYSDKKNGNIYENKIGDFDERIFSNTIIPDIHESFFGKNLIIMRYLKDYSTISTFLGELPKDVLGADSNHSNEIFGSFLPDNIKDISISKNGDKIFYLSNTNNGVIGITLDENGKNKTQVFDSPFSEWTSYWPNNETIILTTKPSGYVEGYSYILYPEEKEFNKILSKIRGLTTKMNEGRDKILYNNETLSLFVFNINENKIKDLKIKTMPEKCVWSKDGINIYCGLPENYMFTSPYPDSWYMGEILFKDKIYKINTENGSKKELIDPSSLYEYEEIDAINLILDEKEENLFFINKKDSYLWGLKLN